MPELTECGGQYDHVRMRRQDDIFEVRFHTDGAPSDDDSVLMQSSAVHFNDRCHRHAEHALLSDIVLCSGRAEFRTRHASGRPDPW